MNTEKTIVGVGLTGIAICVLGMTHDLTRGYIRNSAIDAGVGRWFVDKHGATEFQWVTNTPPAPTGPGIDLRGPRVVSIPWDDAWTNGFVVEPLAQWRKFNTPKCDCRLKDGSTILPQYSGTNYTAPLPYTPGVWTGTNVMAVPNVPPTSWNAGPHPIPAPAFPGGFDSNGMTLEPLQPISRNP